MSRPLSPREERVLLLAAHGYTDAEIAAEMGVLTGTVRYFLSRVYLKLGVDGGPSGISRINAFRVKGWLNPPEIIE